MNSKVLILFGLAVVVAVDAGPLPQSFFSSEESSEEFENDSRDVKMKYDFNWHVGRNDFSDEGDENSISFESLGDDALSNIYGHKQQGDGDHTKGEYYVRLPDGRLQRVYFTVNGDQGYHAEVTYEGEASFESGESFESFEFF